jgi:hypothetical protein
MLKGLCWFFFGVILMSMNGCSNSNTIRIPDQLYFPLRVGNYQIYKVSETDINHSACSDVSQILRNFELKFLISDSTKNIEGNYSYVVHLYKRRDSTQVWADSATWSARVNANQVIVTEGNVSYVNLVFPLVNNTKWDGNLYNNLGEDDYTLKNLSQPFQTSNGVKYPATVTVVQSDDQDFFVFHDHRLEVYAPSIGLVYKETTQLHYFTVSCYGEQKVQSGIIFTQTLKSSGHE